MEIIRLISTSGGALCEFDQIDYNEISIQLLAYSKASFVFYVIYFIIADTSILESNARISIDSWNT